MRTNADKLIAEAYAQIHHAADLISDIQVAGYEGSSRVGFIELLNTCRAANALAQQLERLKANAPKPKLG